MTRVADYFHAWSDIYDAELDERSDADVAFYRDRAVEADGPVLEVGCGTGRIYLELLAAGVDAYGIDVSAEMLTRLRSKADERGLTPAVEQADVAAPEGSEVLDRTFDLVLAPADVLLYNLTIESQVAALENLRSVLAPGGELVCSYFTPDFGTTCELYGTETATELDHDGDRRTVRTRMGFEDVVERIVRVERTVEDAEGERVLEAEAVFKLLPRREMELLLQRTGFDYEVYGGFDGQALTDGADRMVWVARPD